MAGAPFWLVDGVSWRYSGLCMLNWEVGWWSEARCVMAYKVRVVVVGGCWVEDADIYGIKLGLRLEMGDRRCFCSCLQFTATLTALTFH